MSGASGKVLAAIQVTPEALRGGLIAKVRDGDVIEIDANTGTMMLAVDKPEEREAVVETSPQFGLGRELFGVFRDRAGPADSGGSLFSVDQ
jgi:phosphogluconate dehydratase